MTVNEPFTLEPVASKHQSSRYAVVVVFNDARMAPRVESLMDKYAKVTQRHYISVQDRYGNPIDRIAVYILEDVVSDRDIKSTLKNIELSGNIEIIIKKC
ncbi:MAG: hypothetical protein ABIJ47_10910 [Candidatus Bathyarchaeota archaeon]